MNSITNQVHNKFKVFAGTLEPDNSIGSLAKDVVTFVKENKVAAKSIGVEYLELAGRLIITLGYRDDEPWYPIRVEGVSLGKIDILTNDFTSLENLMMKASSERAGIICHELYVTEERDFLMVFLIHQA